MSPTVITLVVVIVAVITPFVVMAWLHVSRRNESPQVRYHRDAKQLGRPWYRVIGPGVTGHGGGGEGTSGGGCDGDD
jgi:hypothetical protein